MHPTHVSPFRFLLDIIDQLTSFMVPLLSVVLLSHPFQSMLEYSRYIFNVHATRRGLKGGCIIPDGQLTSCQIHGSLLANLKVGQ